VAILKDKDAFLLEERKSNAEAEREILLTERTMAKTSQDVTAAQQRLEQYKDEVCSLPLPASASASASAVACRGCCADLWCAIGMRCSWPPCEPR
jgi:predicted S18 family serine protease